MAGSPAESQSLNRYNYCGSNPIGATDPSGHRDEKMRDAGYQQMIAGYAMEAASVILYAAAVGLLGQPNVSLHGPS